MSPLLASLPNSRPGPMSDSGSGAASLATARPTSGRTAVLLIDLQVDFLDADAGRTPVPAALSRRVLHSANRVLAGEVLCDALPVLILNQFPRSDWLGNLVRRDAAIAGTPGARVDPRVAARPDVPVFAKERSDAFSNPALGAYLRRAGVTTVWIIGVMSEGCVRATAMAARRLGFDVIVPLEGIATNAAWKAKLATRLLRRAGVRLVPSVPAGPVVQTGNRTGQAAMAAGISGLDATESSA